MNSSPTQIEDHVQSGLSDDPTSVNQATGVPNSKLEDVFDVSNTLIRTDRDFNVKDQVVINDFEMRFLGGLRFNRKAVDTTIEGSVYNVTQKDYHIGITNLSYAAIINLPDPSIAGVGKTYLIKDEVGGAASTNITIRSLIDTNTYVMLDGGTTTTMSGNYDSRMLYTNGQQWYIGGI